MDKKELKDMTDAELLDELSRLNDEVDDMFVDEEEDKQNILFFDISTRKRGYNLCLE